MEVAEESLAWSSTLALSLKPCRALCPCLAGGEWALVGGEPQQVMRVLCLPGLDASKSPGLSSLLTRRLSTDGEPVQWNVEVVDPPNKDESFVSFWMSSRKRMPEARGKELKTQIMNHIVFVLRLLVEKNAEVVVGIGQGGVVLFGIDSVEVRQLAYSSRAIQEVEQKQMEEAWSRVKAVVYLRACLSPREGRLQELTEVLPELAVPRSAVSFHFMSGTPGETESQEIFDVYRGGLRLREVDTSGEAWKSGSVGGPQAKVRASAAIPALSIPRSYLSANREVAKPLWGPLKQWSRTDKQVKTFQGTGAGGPEWAWVVRRVTRDAVSGQLLADEEVQSKASSFLHRQFDDGKTHDVKTTLYFHPRAEPDSLLAYGSLFSGRCLEHDAHFFEEAPCSNPIFALRSELLRAQQEDPEVNQVIAYKKWEKTGSKVGGKVTWAQVGISDETGRMMNNEAKHFELLPDGLLVRLPGPRAFERGVQFVPVIPDVPRKNEVGRPLVDEQGRELSWRNWVMYLVHCTMATSSGHMSEEDTLTVMESVVWWKGWRGFAQRWLSMCIECRERRGRTLENVLLPGRCRQPFRMIQWDLQGPIDPPSEEGHRWILTGVCPHIKFPVGRALMTKTAEEVTQARVDVILKLVCFRKYIPVT